MISAEIPASRLRALSCAAVVSLYPSSFSILYSNGSTQRQRRHRRDCRRSGSTGSRVRARWKRPRKLLVFPGKKSLLQPFNLYPAAPLNTLLQTSVCCDRIDLFYPFSCHFIKERKCNHKQYIHAHVLIVTGLCEETGCVCLQHLYSQFCRACRDLSCLCK